MSLLKTENTDFDGKIVSCGRDTPGQHSFYIRPGTKKHEIWQIRSSCLCKMFLHAKFIFIVLADFCDNLFQSYEMFEFVNTSV